MGANDPPVLHAGRHPASFWRASLCMPRAARPVLPWPSLGPLWARQGRRVSSSTAAPAACGLQAPAVRRSGRSTGCASHDALCVACASSPLAGARAPPGSARSRRERRRTFSMPARVACARSPASPGGWLTLARAQMFAEIRQFVALKCSFMALNQGAPFGAGGNSNSK